jgi:hypothetical protein
MKLFPKTILACCVMIGLTSTAADAEYQPWQRTSQYTAVRWFNQHYSEAIPISYFGKTFMNNVDVDGDGMGDDSVVLYPLSNDPLSPTCTGQGWCTYDNSLPSANFYGGLVGYFIDEPLVDKFQQALITKSEGASTLEVHSDGRLRRLGGEPISGTALADFYNEMTLTVARPAEWGPAEVNSDDATGFRAFYYWKKDEFLNGYASEPLSFDSDTRISVATGRWWFGIESARFIVKDGSQFYISEDTWGLPGDIDNNSEDSTWGLYTAIDPTATRWAPYNPSTDDPYTALDFDDTTANWQLETFADVQAVGVYLERDDLVTGRVQFTIDDFRLEMNATDWIARPMDIDSIYDNLGMPQGWPNDYDGDMDVDQDDVTTLVEQVIGTRYGDTNLDMTVDEADLAWLADHWKQHQGLDLYGWASGDFTGDGNVDEADLAYLADNWKQPTQAEAVLIPEPMSVLLLGILTGRRPRRCS